MKNESSQTATRSKAGAKEPSTEFALRIVLEQMGDRVVRMAGES